MSDEHEFEPVHGLPERLPAGERILWQGEPTTARFARSAFGVRALAVYFALVIALQAVLVGLEQGSSVAGLAAAAGMLPLAGGALALLVLFAWCYARTTVYTISSARIVIRFGLAVPLTVNLPFSAIAAVDMRRHGDGSGDLVLRLARGHRVGWVHMWPCVQAMHLMTPRPTLRGLDEVAAAAAILADALHAAGGVTTAVPSTAAGAGGLGHATAGLA